MTSETEALCEKVSEHRGEWVETRCERCECEHPESLHVEDRNGNPSECLGGTPPCECRCFNPLLTRHPLDWTLPENAWRLLDSIRRQGYYEVRMTSDMLSLVPTDDAPAEIVQGVFMDLDAEISLEEAAVWLYAKAHGLTPSTEGA